MIKPVVRSPAFTFCLLAFLLLSTVIGRVSAVGSAAPLLQSATETEPNDTPDQANSIDINQTMIGDLGITPPTDAVDYFALTTEAGRVYRAELSETGTMTGVLLKLSLFDSAENLIDEEETSGNSADITWTASDTLYYLGVSAVEGIELGPEYELRIVRFGVTPTPTEPPGWDSCEINDTLVGTWSGTTPPGGPCPISVGALVSDLNFVPFTDQPSPNPDFFVVRVKAGRQYRLETQVTAGVDTVVFLYLPGATDDSQYIAVNDDGPGLGLGSRIEWTPANDGDYLIRVLNQEPLPHESSETYNLSVADVTATPTPSQTPGGPTATPTRPSIPGTPDRFEPNWDFDVASLIGLGVKYQNLNFVPFSGTGTDNDFYKLWVTGGKLYTCETLELGDATNTNMILYSCPSFDCGFAGNDDVQPFDPDDPYRSKITFFSSYTGYLYILLGQVGVEQILPTEWADLSYSLQCYIDLPGTATPTPTSPFVPPPPQPTSTPVPQTPAPPASPTPAIIIVVPMTTPEAPPPPLPLVTPTPQLYLVNLLVYFDSNRNAQADLGEGVADVLARVYDTLTGDLLSIDYTDETGRVQFTVPSRRPVRVSVPYFGFEQIVTATNSSLQIRVSPAR
jgi:hypothetical protein